MRRNVNPDHALARQAGMLCSDPVFRRFLSERYAPAANQTEAAEAVRWICGVESRSEIRPATKAAAHWRALHAQFLVWRDAPELMRDAS